MPPASSIRIIMDAPERGTPETIVIQGRSEIASADSACSATESRATCGMDSSAFLSRVIICPSVSAPVLRSIGLPSAKAMNVGTPLTSNCPARRAQRSMLTEYTSAQSPTVIAIRLITGCIILQDGHHEAQKHNSTGRSDLRTISSKSESRISIEIRACHIWRAERRQQSPVQEGLNRRF